MNRYKAVFSAAITGAICLFSLNGAFAADASMSSGLDFSLEDTLGGINGIISGDVLIETDEFRLECDQVEPIGDTFHATSVGKKPVKVDMKTQGTTFTCGDWLWNETEKTHTLKGKTRIIQKNDKGEETLHIAGEIVTIEMREGGEMKLTIKQSSDPGSPQARLKMKDAKTAGASAAALTGSLLALGCALLRRRRSSRRALDSRRQFMNRKMQKYAAQAVLAAAAVGAGSMLLMGATTSASPFGALQGDDSNGNLDLAAYVIEVSIKNGEFTDLKSRGDVSMEFKGVRMLSDMISYDPGRNTLIAEVTSSPKVRIKSQDTDAACNRVEYDMEREVYNLNGNCVIDKPGLHLTAQELLLWPSGNGKMQMISNSGQASRLGNAISDSGEKTATARKIENSVKDIQEKIGVSEAEAKKLVTGKQKPTELRLDPSGSSKSEKAGSKNGAESGKIDGSNWSQVPGSGMATEE